MERPSPTTKSQRPDAHAAIGNVKRSYYWDRQGSEKEYKRALELDPNSFQAHYGYAFLLGEMGRYDEAIAEMRRAQQLDPLNLLARRGVAILLRFARRYDEAIDQFEMALEVDPNYRPVYGSLGVTYEDMGLYPEAASALHSFAVLGGASEEEVTGLSDAATRGKDDYFRWKLDYFKERAKKEGVDILVFAESHTSLGEIDQAFEWLSKAVEERQHGAVTANTSPAFDPLRDDPRFHDLLRRMNLEPW